MNRQAASTVPSVQQRHLIRFKPVAGPRWRMEGMRVILPALPIASFILLGAHFLREGAFFLTAACAALALAAAWRERRVARLVQAALVLGTVEWLSTAWLLVQQRMATGRPWSRMAVILALVALLTATSIAAVETLRRQR